MPNGESICCAALFLQWKETMPLRGLNQEGRSHLYMLTPVALACADVDPEIALW